MVEAAAMSDDPRTYDYSRPTKTCDVVMKGGITSGVVYPHALCELARTYRFANVGGTSAGAIAAAGAAAAEHGREHGGFEKLAGLPAWIGGGDNLFRLFQPQSRTRPFFRLFAAGLGRKGAGKWLRVAGAALRSFPLTAVAGLAPGVALVVLALWTGSGALAVCAVVAGILLALLGLAVALGLRLVVGLPKALGENGFGLCSGLSPEGSATPALTPWLADLVDDLAAKEGHAAGPLTFGDLGAKGIDLQMMTTNVTHRRPHRMPWSNRELLFDPAELRRFFPERIVAWMEAHPPPTAGREAERTRRRLEALAPLRPFPAPEDLPVVVAARMSLSFPLLISAVPLHALDMTSKRTRDAVEAVDNGRPPRSRSSPTSAGSPTAGSRATSPSISSTRLCPRDRPSRSTSTASTPTIPAARTRPATSTFPRRTSAGCSTAGTGSTRSPGSVASPASSPGSFARCRTTPTRR